MLDAGMVPISSFSSSGRVVFRCDGNEQVGAGHVARCVPLAAALGRLGWTVSFAGEYAGFSHQLLERAQIDTEELDPGAPCGIVAERYDAAVIDSYLIAPAAICELARALPIVTMAEANHCATRGVLLDYHLDRIEPSNARLLAGPLFAPLDPAFAGAGRAGEEIRRVLVTVGGSLAAGGLLAQIVPIVSTSFPDAEIVVLAPESETVGANASQVVHLPSPSFLVDLVGDLDLAVTAAGWTSYELACAGIPQVAIAIATNQRRVVNGLSAGGLALSLDLLGDGALTGLPSALERLHDSGLRRQLAERGTSVLDGRGALRAAAALSEHYMRTVVYERYHGEQVDG